MRRVILTLALLIATSSGAATTRLYPRAEVSPVSPSTNRTGWSVACSGATYYVMSPNKSGSLDTQAVSITNPSPTLNWSGCAPIGFVSTPLASGTAESGSSTVIVGGSTVANNMFLNGWLWWMKGDDHTPRCDLIPLVLPANGQYTATPIGRGGSNASSDCLSNPPQPGDYLVWLPGIGNLNNPTTSTIDVTLYHGGTGTDIAYGDNPGANGQGGWVDAIGAWTFEADYTPTPTITPTPATPTFTPTGTLPDTPTVTNIPTITLTPSVTSTPTITSTSTPSSTVTARPSVTGIPTPNKWVVNYAASIPIIVNTLLLHRDTHERTNATRSGRRSGVLAECACTADPTSVSHGDVWVRSDLQKVCYHAHSVTYCAQLLEQTATPTVTLTPTPTVTPTPSNTPTVTPSITPLPGPAQLIWDTDTPTQTPTGTLATPTPTPTRTPTPADTSTPS